MCKGETRIESSDNAKSVVKSKNTSPSDISESHAPLTARDKELLADVRERVQSADDDDTVLAGLARMTQHEAAAALNDFARKRIRVQCGKSRSYSLFSPNEQASWTMRARKGFGSVFESAVYELVRDDKALARRRK